MASRRRAQDTRRTGRERRLSACGSCHHQYDVSGRSVGSQFHCRCGAVISVEPIEPKEAAVVRCSSCGAPRQGEAPDCGYCGADFTLHERDLHTICPGCMARISDRARYCHHCATLIAPQGVGGTLTDRECPACGEVSLLLSRGLGGEKVPVLECGRCAGLWLGNEVFQHLEQQALKVSASSDSGEPGGARHDGRGGEPQPVRYRPCPVCRRLMHRRNYGRKSTVILDTCQQHGLWFDHGELDSALDWIRRGGLARAREWVSQLEAEEARRRRFGGETPVEDAAWLHWSGGRTGRPLRDFVEAILEFLGL